MRRLFYAAIAAGSLAGPLAQAEPQCSSPTDQKAFDLAALKSEMMVLATGCQGSDGAYNAFVNRFKPELGENERAFSEYFKRTFGRSGQREQDAYVTNLANAQSEYGLHQGTDFCPHTSAIFHEVMALRNGNDLPEYAAGKDLIPTQLGACAAAPAPAAKVRAVSTHAPAHASHGKKKS